jgi:hypothetical protein
VYTDENRGLAPKAAKNYASGDARAANASGAAQAAR